MVIQGAMLLNQTGGWHPEPDFRETYSILSSCWLTLILCLWSAVHLNIPAYGKEDKQKWKKAGFVLLGIFAPETVAWLAFIQWLEARKTHKAITKLLNKSATESKPPFYRRWIKSKTTKDTTPNDGSADTEFEEFITSGTTGSRTSTQRRRRRHTWTMKHSFYLGMGGFALQKEEKIECGILQDVHRLALNQHGFIYLAEHYPDLLPDPSESEIMDKSNSNSLAKTLACLQAGWFCINCIVRVSQKLTISVLELNTLAHALCAFLVYFFWWEKPQDVQELLIITGPLVKDLFTLFAYADGILIRRNRFDGSIVYKIQFGDIKSQWTTTDLLQWRYPNGGPPAAEPGMFRLGFAGKLHDQSVHGVSWQSLMRANQTPTPARMRTHTIREIKDYPCQIPDLDPFIDLSPSDVEMLRMRKEVLDRLALSDPPLREVCDYNSIGQWTVGLASKDMTSLIFTFGMAGVCYGGLHAAAWNSPDFQSHRMLLLWRLSSAFIAASGVAVPAFIGLVVWLKPFGEPIGGKVGRMFPWIRPMIVVVGTFIAMLIGPIILCLFPFRVFLIIGSYYSLQHLPVSSYQQPVWTQYIPHFS